MFTLQTITSPPRVAVVFFVCCCRGPSLHTLSFVLSATSKLSRLSMHPCWYSFCVCVQKACMLVQYMCCIGHSSCGCCKGSNFVLSMCRKPYCTILLQKAGIEIKRIHMDPDQVTTQAIVPSANIGCNYVVSCFIVMAIQLLPGAFTEAHDGCSLWSK